MYIYWEFHEWCFKIVTFVLLFINIDMKEFGVNHFHKIKLNELPCEQVCHDWHSSQGFPMVQSTFSGQSHTFKVGLKYKSVVAVT